MSEINEKFTELKWEGKVIKRSTGKICFNPGTKMPWKWTAFTTGVSGLVTYFWKYCTW